MVTLFQSAIMSLNGLCTLYDKSSIVSINYRILPCSLILRFHGTLIISQSELKIGIISLSNLLNDLSCLKGLAILVLLGFSQMNKKLLS